MFACACLQSGCYFNIQSPNCLKHVMRHTSYIIRHMSHVTRHSYLPAHCILLISRRLKSLNETWTFIDFLERCVIGEYKRGVLAMNEHWLPQYISGSFCAAKFNFLGKTVDQAKFWSYEVMLLVGLSSKLQAGQRPLILHPPVCLTYKFSYDWLLVTAGKLETFDTDEFVILYQLGVKNITNVMEKAYTLRKPHEKTHASTHSYAETWKSVPSHFIAKLLEIYKYDFLMFDYPTDPFLSWSQSWSIYFNKTWYSEFCDLLKNPADLSPISQWQVWLVPLHGTLGVVFSMSCASLDKSKLMTSLSIKKVAGSAADA